MGGNGQEDEMRRWDGEVVWERIWGFLEGISVGSHSCVSLSVCCSGLVFLDKS